MTDRNVGSEVERMKSHDIASFLFFRRRGAIPTEALSVSPAQHRYLEQEPQTDFCLPGLVSDPVSCLLGSQCPHRDPE